MMSANISSTLSKGPYEGSSPAMSRSSTARVSALGKSVTSAPAVRLRAGEASARRLVAGLARKEMVAVADMTGLAPLFLIACNIFQVASGCKRFYGAILGAEMQMRKDKWWARRLDSAPPKRFANDERNMK